MNIHRQQKATIKVTPYMTIKHTALKNITTLIALTLLICSIHAQTSYNVGGGTSNAHSCNAILYDHAGTGNYSPGRNDWFTIYPNTGAVNLLFEELDIAETDTLYIYNGESREAETVALSIGGRAANWVNNGNPIQIGEQMTSATVQNPTGALTLHFVSAANSACGTGFKLIVSCSEPCQRIYTQIDFNQSNPVPHLEDDGYYYIDICPGQIAHIVCYGEFPDNNYSYEQTNANCTFIWNLAGSNQQGVGLHTVDFDFPDGQGSEMTLNMVDNHNCHANTPVSIRVRGSADPIASVPTLPDVCQWDAIPFTIGYDASASNIVVSHVGATQGTSLSVDSTVFIPDGPNCSTQCYSSSVNFTVFPAGATITSAADILSVCINMEHSFIGDINISLICPNGNSALLMPDHNDENNYAFFGLYYEPDGSYCNSADNIAGVGWNYCWSENSAYAQNDGICYMDANILSDPSNTVDSSDKYNHTGYYTPTQSFSNLIGCPLNGLWQIQVCDTWSSDNGYVFQWDLSLDPRLMPQDWSYDVAIDTTYWDTDDITYTSDTTGYANASRPGSYNYVFTLVDEYGCEYSRTIPVTIIQMPVPNLPDTLSICTGAQFATLDPDFNYTGPADRISYLWSNGATDPVIHVSDTGNYIVNISTYNTNHSLACTASDTVYVNVSPMPKADFEGTGLSGCSPLTVHLQSLCSFVDGQSHNDIALFYEWTVTNENNVVVFTSSEANPILVLQVRGIYTVNLLVHTSGGCADSMKRVDYLTVYPQPHANFMYSIADLGIDAGGTYNFVNTTDISAFNASDNLMWHWNYGDQQTSDDFDGPHEYINSGIYTVTLSVNTDFGCSDETSQTIRIPTPYYFYVPNAFSPNGDGKNDIFKPYGYGFNAEKYEFMIFERTGRLVFRTNNYEQGWNGTDNGKKAPFGAYVYVIRTEDMDGEPKEYTGTVTVIR